MAYVYGKSEAPVQTVPNLELRHLTSLIYLLVFSAILLQPLWEEVASKSIRAGAHHKN